MNAINQEMLENLQTVGQLKKALNQFSDDVRIDSNDHGAVTIYVMYRLGTGLIDYLEIDGFDPE